MDLLLILQEWASVWMGRCDLSLIDAFKRRPHQCQAGVVLAVCQAGWNTLLRNNKHNSLNNHR